MKKGTTVTKETPSYFSRYLIYLKKMYEPYMRYIRYRVESHPG